MADKKLNEVTKVTDMAYVPVIMADGSIGQIAKADLASVVAGVLAYQKPKSISTDANEANIVGDYNISYNALNNPAEEWLAMKVLGNGNDIAQIAIGLNTGKTFSRIYKIGVGWNEWKRLDNV